MASGALSLDQTVHFALGPYLVLSSLLAPIRLIGGIIIILEERVPISCTRFPPDSPLFCFQMLFFYRVHY
jgi:hypothetical protein